MRPFSSTGLAARLQSSVVQLPPTVLSLSTREYHGDPGPSTSRRQVHSTAGRPARQPVRGAVRQSWAQRQSTGRPDKGGYQQLVQLEDRSPASHSEPAPQSVALPTGRHPGEFKRGGSFARPENLAKSVDRDTKFAKIRTHARRDTPAFFETEKPFVKPNLHFGLTKSQVQSPTNESSPAFPRWKMDPLIHGRPLSRQEAKFQQEQKTAEEMEAEKELRKNRVNKYQQIERSERPTGHQGDAWETSARVSEWIAKHPKPSEWEFDSLIKMLTKAPRNKVNVVVWNQVLGTLGRHNKLDRMWKALQEVSYRDQKSQADDQMKKRGVDPNTRTFTIMLNCYAGTPHGDLEASFTPMAKLSDKTMTRIITTYNASQSYVAGCIKRVRAAKEEGNKSDLEVLDDNPLGAKVYEAMTSRQRLLRDDKEQISVAATNAYLKLLGKYGLWDQMDNIYLAMDKEGPLAPTNRTYSILFSALLNRMAQQTEKRWAPARAQLSTDLSLQEFGSRARALWDSAVKQFHPNEKPKGYQWDKTKRIDEDLALLAIKAFLSARPEDQRLALSLIPFLWKLPEPTAAKPASTVSEEATDAQASQRSTTGVPAAMLEVPLIRVTPKSATLLLVLTSRANKQTHAVTWARALYARKEMKRHADFGFFRAVMHCLASDGDTVAIAEILDSYQPPTGATGWHIYIWENALMAARKSSDFEFAMDMIRRMAHLPSGVEDGVPEKQRQKYKWTPPGGNLKDVQGHEFKKPDPVTPSAKCLSLLFKTAFAAGSPSEVDTRTRQAHNVFSSFPFKKMFTIPDWDYKHGTTIRLLEDDPSDFDMASHPSVYSAAEWRLELARDVRRASEILSERATPEEKEELDLLHKTISNMLGTWGLVLDPKASRQLAGQQVGLRNQRRMAGPVSALGTPPATPAPEPVGLKATPARVEDLRKASIKEEDITDIDQLIDDFDEFDAAFGEDESLDYEDEKPKKGDKVRWDKRVHGRVPPSQANRATLRSAGRGGGRSGGRRVRTA